MAIERADDWANYTSGLGGTRDKHRGLTFKSRDRLSPQVIQTLWEQNALVAREIELLADDALREGWEITEIEMEDEGAVPPTTDQIYQWRDELLIDEALLDATKWSRAYGAALLVIPVADGRDADQEMAPGVGSTIMPARVIAAPWVVPGDTDVSLYSPTYLKTLSYDVTGLGGDGTQEIHHSRVILFEPIKLPAHALQEIGKQFGPSVVDRMYDEMGRDGAAASHAVAMMYVASILCLQVGGMRAAFQAKGGPEKLQEWFAALNQRLSSMGMAAIDSEDTLSSVSNAHAGTDALLQRTRDRFGAVVSMPRELFFNESPAGLNAGELSGPQELWFQKVGAYQNNTLTPALDRWLDVLFRCKGYRVKSWQIKWRDLWVRSDESSAKISELNSKSDSAYILAAAVTPDEVRRHRFVEGRLGALELDDDAQEAAPLDLSGPAEPEEIAAAVAAPEVPRLADGAMGGPQITALMSIVEKVGSGGLPRDAAIAIIAATYPALAAQAEAIVGSAGMAAAAPVAAAAPAPDLTTLDDPAVAPTMEPVMGEPEPAAPPSMAPPPSDLGSPRDLAAMYGLPTRAITAAIGRGELEYWGIGSHKRVSGQAVAALMRGHEAELPPGA